MRRRIAPTVLFFVLTFSWISNVSKAEEFSKSVLELQGVWRLADEPIEPLVMARLVVHGSYFLLIYQWPDQDVVVVEMPGFSANGERVKNKDKNGWVEYAVYEEDGKFVNFEVIDQSPNATSKYCEINLQYVGSLPDLNLKK